MTPYEDISPEIVAKAYHQIYPEWKRMKAQIEAAKPILDKIIAICQDRNDVTTCEECCDKKCCEEYDLNAILFPRKENQRLKPTACTYKKTVPNCDDIDCNDCPHVAKPEEENTTP